MAHYMVKDNSIYNGYLDEYEAFVHFTSQEDMLEYISLHREYRYGTLDEAPNEVPSDLTFYKISDSELVELFVEVIPKQYKIAGETDEA